MTTTVVKETAKKASTKVIKFAAGGAGFGLGLFGMGQLNKLTASLPSFIPEIIKKLAPGLAVMFLSVWLSTKAKDDRIQAALLGVGFSGGADALRRLLGSIFPGVKDYVPGLDGTQGAQGINVGDFQMPYYWENAFQGLNGMSMQGMSMQGMSMQGGGNAFSLSGSPYALNGGAYALNGRKRRGLRGAIPAYALN